MATSNPYVGGSERNFVNDVDLPSLNFLKFPAFFYANRIFIINILLPSLALSIFGINAPFFGMLAAYSELGVALLGFYCAGAVFLNSYFGRALLPLGKPFGFIRKGPKVSPVKDAHVIPLVPAAKK